MRQRYTAATVAGLREWEAGDWITSMHPQWRGVPQQVSSVGKRQLLVTKWRDDGTRHTRWLTWLPGDVRLVRKGVRDVA